LATLPWAAKATVRKFYPSTLSVEIERAAAYALWQKRGTVFVVDKSGTEIVELEESRFGKLPFTVGKGANLKAAEFLDTVLAERRLPGRCAPPSSSPAAAGIFTLRMASP
jgi:cell division septal protein FtsQ